MSSIVIYIDMYVHVPVVCIMLWLNYFATYNYMYRYFVYV